MDELEEANALADEISQLTGEPMSYRDALPMIAELHEYALEWERCRRECIIRVNAQRIIALRPSSA